MIHVTTTQPIEEPVTLAEMRQHLGITQKDDTSRDVVLTSRIAAARTWAEEYTCRRIMNQTLTGYDSSFHDDAINLIGPVSSITRIQYTDNTGTLQTLSANDYVLDAVTSCVIPAWGKTWPAARMINNSVQIVYVAGYDYPELVPEPIREAIKFIVGQWEVFQSSIEGVVRPFTIPFAAMQLLDFYRDLRGKI
jgi:uncharacterized phiE125 gp8 family phage protein